MSSKQNARVAAIQMVSGPRVEANLATAARLIADAVQQGAQLVLLPEYFPIIGAADADRVRAREAFGHGPVQDWLAESARRHGIWLIAGSLPLTAQAADKMCNSTLVYDPQGECVQRYDKLHLFGFDNGRERYDEGRVQQAGEAPVAFDWQGEFGSLRVALSICYDLRFPELYRQLAPHLILAPSAFTHTTGAAHWELLLRTRAVENLAYVMAPAQGGLHANGRRTWGHSMVIDPWGQVLACQPEGEGLAIADLDPARLAQCRSQLPALQHRKL